MNSLVNSIAAVAVTAALSVGNLSAREFPLSDLTFSTILNVYGGPVVAAGNSGALALWTEAHTGVWAAPLDREGRLRGQSAFPITATGGAADVIWNGTSYFMAWNSGNFLSSALHVAEVNEDGRVVRDRVIEVPFGAAALAWNGTNLLVIGFAPWSAPQPGLFAVTLDRDFSVLTQVHITRDGPFSIDVVAAGGRFFLATAWYTGMNGYWFSADGQLESSFVIEPSRGTTADAYRPQQVAVSSDGETVVAVWTATAHNSPMDVKAAMVTASAGIGPVRQISTGSRLHAFAPDVQWNGREQVLVFLAGVSRGQSGDWLELVGLRLGRDAQPLDPEPFVISGAHPRAQFGGFAILNDRYIGVMREYALGARNTAVTFDQAFRQRHREVFSRAATFQDHPAVATDGTEFLAVWIERTAETNAIYAGRITRQGERLDGRGIRVFEVQGLLYLPDVAAGGGIYLIIWNSGSALLGARFSSDGVLLDQQPIAIRVSAGGASWPTVRWNGRDFLVAWTESSLESTRIVGAVVSPSGAVGPPKVLSPDSVPDESYPVVMHWQHDMTWDGLQFLLSYVITRSKECFFPGSCPSRSTSAVVALSPDGDPLGSAVEFRGDTPRAASSGEEFLVTFSADRHFWGVIVRVMNGQIIAGPPLFLARNAGGRPLWDGSAYRVYFRFTGNDGKSALAFRRVDRGGNVLDGIFRFEENRTFHDIARSASGEILGVFVGSNRAAPLFGMPRVFGWFLHDAPVIHIPTRQRGVR